MRHSLRPVVKVHGINFDLAFGTVIHKCLEEYYNPVLQRDLQETFSTEWHALAQDIQEKNYPFYEEHGEDFERLWELGTGMLTNYQKFARENDNFEVIAVEHDFIIPLGFDAHSARYAHNLPVTYKGRMDAVVRDLETGRYGIIDHKTSSRIDEDYFAKLDMDEQVTSYMWAAEQEALGLDLPYTEIDFVLYNVLRKAAPRPPTVLSSGTLSLDRQKESTTYEMFLATVVECNLEMWLHATPKAQAYLEYLKEAGEHQFIIRERVKRNRHEVQSMGQRIKWEAQDMLRKDLFIYPTPTGDWYCLKCPFRAPCLATNDGSDVQDMLHENYEPNTDR